MPATRRVMRTKARWLAVLQCLILAILISGCQLSTQEETQEGPLKLSGPTENCMTDSLKSVEAYFLGKSSNEEINSVFGCVTGALDLFKSFGRGASNRNSFSSNELRSFFERHFLRDVKLSESFLTEIMRIKTTILGGSQSTLTKVEIDRLIDFLEALRIEALRLRPYVNILNQRQGLDSADPELLEQAFSDFIFSMDTLGAMLGRSQKPYKLENFQALLNEFQKIYSARSDWKGPKWFAEQAELIASAKTVLIRPEGTTIAPSEWHLLFSDIGRLYSLYLRFRYSIRGRDLFYGEGLRQLEIGIVQVASLFEDAIAIKDPKVITYDVLSDFILKLGASGSFEFPVKSKTIVGLLKPILEKAFNPIITGSDRLPKLDPSDPLSVKGIRIKQSGLTKANLSKIRETLLGWIEMQKMWERLELDVAVKNPQIRVGKPIPLKLIRPLWSSYSSNYQEAWSDLKSIFDRPIPPSIRPNGTLIFENSKTVVYDRNSFANLNWKQQVVRSLSYGYISDPVGLRMAGITESQFEKVFNDFQALGKDLKFLDDSDSEIWKSGFTVSNIFLFSSNGDDRIGFHEAVDLFITSFASVEVREKIEKDLLANCKHGKPDIVGKPTLDASCWRDVLRRGYLRLFKDLPAWVTQMIKASSDAWEKYFDNIERASRRPDNLNGPLASNERSRAVLVHHYIESLYTRWDSNLDGALSLYEADKAYFLFRRLLQNASGFKKDEEVRALYFYLLAYGEPPDEGNLGDIIKWLWWKSNPDVWEHRVHADRERLMEIFGSLAKEL